MKRTSITIFLLLSFVHLFSQELQSRKEDVFKVGEVLNYKLRYGFITAAEATLTVQESDVRFDDKPIYHLVAQGKTSGTFDVFYKVRNRYDSYIDRQTLLPYLYTENVREADYKRTDKARFYQSERKVVASKGTFKAKEQTFDLVSAYYFARSLELTNIKTGTKFKLPYYLDKDVKELEITYVGKERIKTQLGYVNCLKFSPSIEPGRIFRKDSRLYLWITDDGNRIPVKAQVEILVGSVTMELSSVKNLKYPLSATKK
jgi:hypothetical protein